MCSAFGRTVLDEMINHLIKNVYIMNRPWLPIRNRLNCQRVWSVSLGVGTAKYLDDLGCTSQLVLIQSHIIYIIGDSSYTTGVV